MNSPRFLHCLLLAGFLGFATDASAVVRWRVSVKVFTNVNGNRPSGTTDTAIQNLIADYNLRLQSFARGLVLELTEVVELDSSLNSWYNVEARNSANRSALQAAAGLAPGTYVYRSSAINVYINNSESGVCCGAGNGLVFMGNPGATSSTMFHEIGHLMGLNHTQGEGCNGCCPDALGCCDSPATDHVSDTIVDVACWTTNQIANANFGVNANNLTASQSDQLNDVWFNLMSYHWNGLPTLRLTPGQIDRAAGESNTGRDNIAANYFRFVDNSAGNDNNNGLSIPLSFRTFAGAISGAGTSDVLAFSAGTYTRSSGSAYRITKACVLTSRKGTVRLRQVAP